MKVIPGYMGCWLASAPFMCVRGREHVSSTVTVHEERSAHRLLSTYLVGDG